MRRATYVGIGGVAGSGKDFFFQLLKRCLEAKKGDEWLESKYVLKAHRYSLADSLIKEINEFTECKYGINSLSCSPEDKEKIRPLMLFHGLMMRSMSEGRYWIEQLEKKIEKEMLEGFMCITDIRYDEHEKDEVHWIKKEKNGILVHLRLLEKDKHGNYHPRPPANEFEKKFDSKIRKQADYTIDWDYVEGPKEYVERKLCINYIDDFLNWLLNKNVP